MDIDDGEGILEAARAIRFYLADLVGPHAAASLDRQIADQLTDPVDPAQAVSRLRSLLDEHRDTRWFLAEVLKDAPAYRPPYHPTHYGRRQTGGRASPIGDPSPIDTVRYTCPIQDHYTWYRPEVGTPIPECPTCGVVLTRT